jgi:hypothetical protein
MRRHLIDAPRADVPASRRDDEGEIGMRAMRQAITTAGLLTLALMPIIGAVSPDPSATINPPSRMPVAIAQPLASTIPSEAGGDAVLPETGMLLLVGTALMGLAFVVRRTTNHL